MLASARHAEHTARGTKYAERSDPLEIMLDMPVPAKSRRHGVSQRQGSPRQPGVGHIARAR